MCVCVCVCVSEIFLFFMDAFLPLALDVGRCSSLDKEPISVVDIESRHATGRWHQLNRPTRPILVKSTLYTWSIYVPHFKTTHFTLL